MMTAVSYEKAVRDGRTLLNHARAVIVLNNQGDVANILYRDSGSLLNVIGILGPVYHKGTTIALAVRSEIGIGRAVPYKASEKRLHQDRLRTPSRKSFPLSYEEMRKILREIIEVIQRLIDKDVMHWKNLTYIKSRRYEDSQIYKCGRFITMPNDLEHLKFLCLARDIETRVKGHLQEFIEHTKDKLIVAKSAYYPPSQIKRKWWAKEIAYNLEEALYGEYFFEIIREALGKEGSKLRSLFEQILEVYKIEPDAEKDREYLRLRNKYVHDEVLMLRDFPLDVMVHTKRVTLREKKYPKRVCPTPRHAVGMLRLEVRPSDDAVKQHTKNKNVK